MEKLVGYGLQDIEDLLTADTLYKLSAKQAITALQVWAQRTNGRNKDEIVSIIGELFPNVVK